MVVSSEKLKIATWGKLKALVDMEPSDDLSETFAVLDGLRKLCEEAGFHALVDKVIAFRSGLLRQMKADKAMLEVVRQEAEDASRKVDEVEREIAQTVELLTEDEGRSHEEQLFQLRAEMEELLSHATELFEQQRKEKNERIRNLNAK